MKDWCEKCLHQKINWYMTFQNCNDSNEYVFHCGKPCPYRKYVELFFLVHHKKRGREEEATKNESLIGACRNRVSAWLTSWSFSLSDIQCFMSLDWQTDHFWQKINLKMKETYHSYMIHNFFDRCNLSFF